MHSTGSQAARQAGSEREEVRGLTGSRARVLRGTVCEHSRQLLGLCPTSPGGLVPTHPPTQPPTCVLSFTASSFMVAVSAVSRVMVDLSLAISADSALS
jgi:hypothetical protein